MGKISKDSSKTAIISFIGLGIGYVNKAVLFPLFLLQDQIGLISLLFALGALFAQLGNLGTSHAIVRFFPFLDEKRKRSFFLFNLWIIISGLVLFIVVSFLFKEQIYGFYKKESNMFIHYAFWVYLLGAANLFFLFFENFLKARFKVVLPVLIQEFYLRIAASVTIVLYAIKWVDFETFLIIHLLVHLLPFLALLVIVLKDQEIVGVSTSYGIPSKFKKIIIGYSALTYLNTVGSGIIFSIDTIMLAGMAGLKETGIYSTVMFMTSALLIPYRSIHRTASAFVTNHWKNKNIKELNDLYKRVSSMNLIFISYLLLLVGWNIVEFFSFLPKEFEPGIVVFFALSIGRFADAYCGINGYIIVTSKKYHVDIYFTFSLIVSGIILNYLLIPIYGGLGSAWATTIVITVYNGLRVFYLWKEYNLILFEYSNLKVLLVSAIISMTLLLFPAAVMHPILAIIIKSVFITVVFFVLILYFRVEPELNLFYAKIQSRYFKK